MWAREYELIYIARPDLSDEELATIFDRTKKIITERDGHVLTVDEWGKKKLAYEIKKYAKGHFMYLLFLGDAAIVNEVERTFKLDDGLLRFLTVKVGDRVEIETRLAEAKEAELLKAAARTAEEAAADAGAAASASAPVAAEAPAAPVAAEAEPATADAGAAG